MTNDPTGHEYELFVAGLQEAILRSDAITTHQNINVETNKKLKDKRGGERQFDIYWEYQLGGFTYKTIIECKDHSRPLSVDKIESLAGKMLDFPDIRAVVATSTGYQSGAKDKADECKIDLLVVREQNESDWLALDDDMARIRFLVIDITLDVPPRILAFHPIIDGKWVRENTSLDTSKPIKINDQNDRIFVEEEGTRYSLLELASKQQAPRGDRPYGIFEKTVTMRNGFLIYKGDRLKMLSYRVEYLIREPLRQRIETDIAKEIVGVVEYLQKGSKKSVLRNGTVWDG